MCPAVVCPGPEPVPLSVNLRTTFAFAFSAPRSSSRARGISEHLCRVHRLCQDFLCAPGWRDPHQTHVCVTRNEVDCKLKKSLRGTGDMEALRRTPNKLLGRSAAGVTRPLWQCGTSRLRRSDPGECVGRLDPWPPPLLSARIPELVPPRSQAAACSLMCRGGAKTAA